MYKLMIIDNSNITRNKITRAIAHHKQFSLVAMVNNSREALDDFLTYYPDIITIDLALPEMDALECIRELINLNPKVNILVISEIVDEYMGLVALKYGARGVLCKPFNDKDLLNALEAMIV